MNFSFKRELMAKNSFDSAFINATSDILKIIDTYK